MSVPRCNVLLYASLVAACGQDGSNDGGSAGTAGTTDAGPSSTAAASTDISSTAVASSSLGSNDGDGSDAADGTGTSGGPAGDACVPDGVQDDFSEPELDLDAWSPIGVSGFDVEIVDGRLTFTPTPGFTNTRAGFVRTDGIIDFDGCTSWVEVPQLPGSRVPTASASWSVTSALGSSGAYIRVSGSNLTASVAFDADTEEATVPYDADAHRWWRIRDADGVLYVDASPDGSAWTVLIERAHSLDLTQARMSFYAGAQPGSGEFPGAQFDNVNVPP